MHMFNEEADSLTHNNKLKILDNNKLLLYSNMIVLSFNSY
jgi:hypothetical protein